MLNRKNNKVKLLSFPIVLGFCIGIMPLVTVKDKEKCICTVKTGVLAHICSDVVACDVLCDTCCSFTTYKCLNIFALLQGIILED